MRHHPLPTLGSLAVLLLGLTLPARVLGQTTCSWNPGAPCCDACAVTADVNGDGVVDGKDLGLVDGTLTVAKSPGALVDFNRDGVVGCFDKKFVLGNWGPCDGVETDLDGDGDVDGDDISVLVAAYGTCAHYVPQTGALLPLDLDNNGRIDQNDADIVTCFWGAATTALPNVDFDADGRVDAADLDVVLRAVGTLCPYDLNQNGLVEWSDIKVLIGKWPI